MKHILILASFIFLSEISFGQTDHVIIESSREFPIYSEAVDDTFHIQVSLPPGYSTQETNYPIIYLLDSDRSFGLVNGIAFWLKFDRLIPDVIIVGIAYKKQWWQKRSRDYTPTRGSEKDWGGWALAGGSDHFLNFIDKELNSKLKDFRIDWTNKTIIGHSFGGIFATYALFNKPHLFDNYISISPALNWDDKYLFNTSVENLQSKTSKSIVFTAIGELDRENIVTPWREFNKYVEENKIPNLDWYSIEYKDQTHSSVLPVAITDGLRKVLDLKK